MFVIMGATGNTGAPIAEALLAAGERVRVIGRSAERLARFTARGAEAAVGHVEDGAFVAGAFRGATTAYVMIPPDYSAPDYFGRCRRIVDAAIRGIREGGVARVALLSSLGGQHAAGTGPVRALHAAEEALGAVAGIDLLVLRPGYFHENLFGSLGLIRHQGVNGGVIAPDVPVDMIATADIAELAARMLLRWDVRGTVVRELAGPRPYTLREATAIVGAAIGRPDLAYVQFPDEGMVQGLVASGFAADLAALFVEMSHGINAGLLSLTAPATPERTGTRTLERLAPAFAAAYGAA